MINEINEDRIDKIQIEIKKLPAPPKPKELTEEEKEKKKKSKRAGIIAGIIIILILLASLYFRWSEFIEEFNSIKTELISAPWWTAPVMILGVIVILGGLGYVLTSKYRERIEATGRELLYKFWIPVAVFIIMFLGWLHSRYPYESHWTENVTQSFCTLGNVTNTLRNVGADFSGILWIILGLGFVYFTYGNITDIWKKDNEDYMDAQQLLNLVEKEMKEGKYEGDDKE